PVLVRLLEDDEAPEVRASAAAALGFQKVASTLPALCRAASDPSADVRFDVAFALGCFDESDWENPRAATHRPEVERTLLRLMDDRDVAVRDWATFAMHQGDHDTPAVRARLWRALDDPDPEVRGEAVTALAEFGDRRV